MDEQLVQQITENVSKNPNYEIYHLRKYFGKTLDNKYLNLEFTDKYIDENGENWDTSGITDSEIIDILINRIKTNKVSFKYIDTEDKLIREHIISSLENLQELIDG